jgi:hypothetical protein
MCNMLIQVQFSILLNINIIKKGNLADTCNARVSAWGVLSHLDDACSNF